MRHLCSRFIALEEIFFVNFTEKFIRFPLTLVKRLANVLQTTEEDVLNVAGHICVQCKTKLDNVEKLKKVEESLKSSFELARSSKDVIVSKRMVNSPLTGAGRGPPHAIKPSSKRRQLYIAYADTADMDRARPSPTHVSDTDSTIVDSSNEKRNETKQHRWVHMYISLKYKNKHRISCMRVRL